MLVDCSGRNPERPDGPDHSIEGLNRVADLDDPRLQANVLDPLEALLLWCLWAVIREADGGVDVALEGPPRRSCRRRVLPFRHGGPRLTHGASWLPGSTPRRVSVVWIAWVEHVTGAGRGGAIDGTTWRRSFDPAAAQGLLPMSSAWREPPRLGWGQPQVADQSHAITAIPQRLEW